MVGTELAATGRCGRARFPWPHAHAAARGGGERSYTRRRPEESVLYGVVQHELETFLARAQERERPVPRFVERELRTFLRCGILAHGFVRVHCDDCGLDRVVAFSCKGRGFCPSCGGRRMADTAAHLVDRVLPEVPVRQWVLSLPWQLRYRLAYDAPLVQEVLGIFVRAVFASLRRLARVHWGGRSPRASERAGASDAFGDRIEVDDLEVLEDKRCASVGGVSLHANVAVPARDRRRLQRLCRYVACPPVSTQRLSRLADGTLLHRLKHRWRDGTSHVVFAPQKLIEKLAALVPPPRFHLARYHGILGPCASERDRIVPAGDRRRHALHERRTRERGCIGVRRYGPTAPAARSDGPRSTGSVPESVEELLPGASGLKARPA